MKWPHTDVGQKENHMPLPNSKVTTFPHSEEQSLRQQVTSLEEWRALAGAWPLKRLVALWNDLPGVPPVQKFTNREIALGRIWRFLHPPEQTTARKAAEQKNPFREGSKAAQVYALLARSPYLSLYGTAWSLADLKFLWCEGDICGTTDSYALTVDYRDIGFPAVPRLIANGSTPQGTTASAPRSDELAALRTGDLGIRGSGTTLEHTASVTLKPGDKTIEIAGAAHVVAV